MLLHERIPDMHRQGLVTPLPFVKANLSSYFLFKSPLFQSFFSPFPSLSIPPFPSPPSCCGCGSAAESIWMRYSSKLSHLAKLKAAKASISFPKLFVPGVSYPGVASLNLTLTLTLDSNTNTSSYNINPNLRYVTPNPFKKCRIRNVRLRKC